MKDLTLENTPEPARSEIIRLRARVARLERLLEGTGDGPFFETDDPRGDPRGLGADALGGFVIASTPDLVHREGLRIFAANPGRSGSVRVNAASGILRVVPEAANALTLEWSR